MSSNNAHIFALYFADIAENKSIIITDRDTVHRITRVLRLAVKEQLVLFNKQQHASAFISEITNRSVTLQTTEVINNSVHVPHITFLLPLLKREALSHVVYSLAEAGVSTIQLVTTAKTQRSWGGDKEADRLQRIIIAAAEQSKNFAFPELKAPVSLESALGQLQAESSNYFCDPEGDSIKFLLCDSSKAAHSITLAIGPEGDLIESEKELLDAHSFKKVRLTPTVLRAETAAFLVAGIFRSFFLSR